jgi:hypothetical protein
MDSDTDCPSSAEESPILYKQSKPIFSKQVEATQQSNIDYLAELDQILTLPNVTSINTDFVSSSQISSSNRYIFNPSGGTSIHKPNNNEKSNSYQKLMSKLPKKKDSIDVGLILQLFDVHEMRFLLYSKGIKNISRSPKVVLAHNVYDLILSGVLFNEVVTNSSTKKLSTLKPIDSILPDSQEINASNAAQSDLISSQSKKQKKIENNDKNGADNNNNKKNNHNNNNKSNNYNKETNNNNNTNNKNHNNNNDNNNNNTNKNYNYDKNNCLIKNNKNIIKIQEKSDNNNSLINNNNNQLSLLMKRFSEDSYWKKTSIGTIYNTLLL